MKIGITYRLFFIILSAICLTILCLCIVMWWSLDREFNRYIGTMDQNRLTQAITELSRKYEENNGWWFLDKTRLHWGPLGLSFSSPESDFSPISRWEHGKIPSGITGPQQRPPGPLLILDADRKILFGLHAPNADVYFRPVIVRGRTVGYAGLKTHRDFLTPYQVQFLSRQKNSLILSASGLVLLAILLSFPLARRLVRPVTEIAAATHDIASGRYDTRVSHISSSDEIGQLARSFNAMALTLENTEKARRQWIADVSHELRTPVAVLQGEIEAMMDGIHALSPERIHSLHTETLRLKSLVEDLYQLSLSDSGTLTYRKEDLEPTDILQESVESYRPEFERKPLTLVLDLAGCTGTICFADRERLRQLFINLLENSLRYTDAGGLLRIGAQTKSGILTIEFQDSEPGVSTGDRERLFERFFRVEASRNRESGGAGIGLALCKNIVDAHEGTISAHESALGGLLIRITLPVFEESA